MIELHDSGRAIRHKNDWASLILLDGRYSSQKVRGKLPAWINEDIIVAETFGRAIKALAQFYKGRSARTTAPVEAPDAITSFPKS